jgi:hypothetical protein
MKTTAASDIAMNRATLARQVPQIHLKAASSLRRAPAQQADFEGTEVIKIPGVRAAADNSRWAGGVRARLTRSSHQPCCLGSPSAGDLASYTRHAAADVCRAGLL